VEIPLDGGDIISTTKHTSPPEDLQNHAQTCKGGGSGDIFRVSSMHLMMYTYIEQKLNEKLLKNVKGESKDTLKYPVRE